MKIRIKGNTVRYRLSKMEVAALAENGILKEADPIYKWHFIIRHTANRTA